jgi:NDP-sugar pyrophosphorylase family protein
MKGPPEPAMICGGIIAAGHGTRLSRAGIAVPKQLVEIGGIPLIGRQVAEFERAALSPVFIILNSTVYRGCRDYLEEAFPSADIRPFCRDTKSSAESFIRLLKRVFRQMGRECLVLASTVDSIYRPGLLTGFMEEVLKRDEKEALFLGITRFVDDEKPLFCRLDSSGRILALGGDLTGGPVTCGLYCLPASWAKGVDPDDFPALRQFLAWLLRQGRQAYGIDVGKVIDVDRPQDLKEAEEFLARG